MVVADAAWPGAQQHGRVVGMQLITGGEVEKDAGGDVRTRSTRKKTTPAKTPR
jgi:hypothetical protein